MAIDRLKFRCYRCNQLLGATPNKAGSIVTCPKCSAELLIPIPELRSDESSDVQTRLAAPARPKVRSEVRPKPETEFAAPSESIAAAATAVQPVPRRSPSASSIEEFAAALPPDLIDLRPEDLRVEAEFFESLTRQPAPPPAVTERAPWPPTDFLEAQAASETFASSAPAPLVVESAPVPPAPAMSPPITTQTVNLAPAVAELLSPPPVPQRAEAALLAASIEIEHPTILPPGTEIRRVREVVLPASVVLSWSLFVLVGIALSFVAGLLMGHFLWTAH